MEARSSSLIKVHSAHRHLVWRFLQPLYGHIRVAEFPKSGGTWLCQMISAATGVNFPRNTGLSLTSKCIQHSHLPGPTRYKTVLVVRDVRDVLTSAYFHFLMASEEKDPFLLSKWKEIMKGCNVEDVIDTMPTFIKKFHEEFEVSRIKINWSSHTESYLNTSGNIFIVKYEDMLDRPQEILETSLSWLGYVSTSNLNQIIENYSFKSQTSRKQGDEDRTAFLRKGIAGDWKNYFNQEAIDLVNSLYGSTMIKLEYG
jgi:Sulfotransferase domain.